MLLGRYGGTNGQRERSPLDKESWEEQYQAGRWAYLANIVEMSRYPFIAAHIQRDAERTRVLDVGGAKAFSTTISMTGGLIVMSASI